MDSFKFWIFSICGATAITAVFKILLSGSSLKKTLNIFFSLFVLFYTVIPINGFLDNSFKNDTENGATSYNEFYEDGYRAIVEESIKNTCKELKVNVLSFDMKSYIDEEGYLNIESLDIETDCSDRSNEIKEYLKRKLGFEVNVS